MSLIDSSIWLAETLAINPSLPVLTPNTGISESCIYVTAFSNVPSPPILKRKSALSFNS